MWWVKAAQMLHAHVFKSRSFKTVRLWASTKRKLGNQTTVYHEIFKQESLYVHVMYTRFSVLFFVLKRTSLVRPDVKNKPTKRKEKRKPITTALHSHRHTCFENSKNLFPPLHLEENIILNQQGAAILHFSFSFSHTRHYTLTCKHNL